ncbi:PilZ domain-containing protein [Minwuia sp.]|uniref:PilZ domain-containing protein n=1 Tax=Minwuia sp. TaxID=2493630 RepID=UPI003A8E9033
MKEFKSLIETAVQDGRTWPFGQRRAAERRPADISVRVERHRGPVADDHTVRNVSDGGMLITPRIDGYVGEHVYLDGERLPARLEARITYQHEDATGIAFVARVDRPDVVQAVAAS